MKIPRILKQIALTPLKLTGKLLLIPLKPMEKPMTEALKAALISTLRKSLRTVLAVLLSAIAAGIPAMVDALKHAQGTMWEQAIYGALITGFVALLAFIERFVSVKNAKPQA